MSGRLGGFSFLFTAVTSYITEWVKATQTYSRIFPEVRSEKNGLAGATFALEACERILFLVFSSFWKPTTCFPWLLAPTSIFKANHSNLCFPGHVSPICMISPFPCKDPCDYIGLTQVIQDIKVHHISKSLVSFKITYSQVL